MGWAGRTVGRASVGYGCSVRPVLMWSDKLLAYDFGPRHPMAPTRLDLTMRLLAELGLLGHFDVITPRLATAAELELAHDPAFLAALRQASATGIAPPGYGLGDSDTPIFPGMYEAAARIAGAAATAARLIAGGHARRVFSPAGGLHHAVYSSSAGFCVLNDAAVALALLRPLGPLVYIDLDVHHGDGVQQIFASDPRVTTISIHQHPAAFFPHTGYASEVGTGPGLGHSVNLALPAGTTDDGWLRAIDAVVEPVLRELRPYAIVTQHGCDTHATDPLGGLSVSVDAQREAARMMAALAEAYAGGRWIALGGGGYDIRVVPRSWAHVAAAVAGVDIDPATPIPERWRTYFREVTGEDAALTMGDGVSVSFKPFYGGHDPANSVDRAIRATRNAIFPSLGLDPLTD